MRVALDTNVLVSAIGTRGLCADVVRIVLRDHDLIAGEQVLTELRRNLTKKLRLASDVAAEYDGFLRRQAAATPDAEPIRLAKVDPADAQVLGDAVAGDAELLVTGDRALLTLGARAPLVLLNPRQFWEQVHR
ncbi:MAG: putative toxin-antitoxin system toxin component, PIN family [Gemmatimonadaceae bacterium]